MQNSDFCIDIIIVEDNEFYKNSLTRELINTISNLELKSDIKITYFSYSNPILLIDAIHNNHFKGKNIIAFIDYYLGDGINGNHIIKTLFDNYKNLKIILLSQSKYIISTFRNKGRNRSIDLIPKDKYTLPICSLFLEQFIESYGQIKI